MRVAAEECHPCDFPALMFKRKLTGFVATLSASRQAELKRVLARALQLD